MHLDLPVVLPEVDWDNTLTRGLKNALVFDSGYAFDAAQQRPIATAAAFGTSYIGSTQHGTVLQTPGGASLELALNEDWSGPCTVVYQCLISSVDSPWGVLWKKAGTGGVSQLQAGRNNTTNNWYALRLATPVLQLTGTSVSADLGALATFALSNEDTGTASDIRYSKNGSLVQASTYGSYAQTTGPGSLYLGGGTTADTATQDSAVYWLSVLRFDRVLSAEEVAAIGNSPRQLLVQERRIWVPVSAGGGSTSLTVNETAHAHSADALTLTTSAVLTIADATHAHAAESPAPSSSLGLTVADALHGHATDNLTLDTTGAATLTTQDATHAHAVDAPMLYTDWLLAVAEATHGHAADNVSLSDAPELAPQDAAHGHTADVLALSADTWLTIQQATQAQAADNVTLGGVAPEPWPLLAARGVSAHGHGRARPEQLSTATRSNVQ